LGPWEIIAILAVVLIVFGVGKLPQAMGELGKGIRNFKKGVVGEDVDDEKSGSKREKTADKATDIQNATS
jgi:sec-independent protein translocase protein TatA